MKHTHTHTHTPKHNLKDHSLRSNTGVHFNKFALNTPSTPKHTFRICFFGGCGSFFSLNQHHRRGKAPPPRPQLTVHSEHKPHMVEPTQHHLILQIGICTLLHNYNIMKYRSPSQKAPGEGYRAKAAGRWAKKERQGKNKTHCQLAMYLLLVLKKLELSNPVIIARIKILLLT